MLKTIALILLALPFAACATDESTAPPSDLAGTEASETDPPQPVLPRIRSITWRWAGCGPTTTQVPFSLTVDVDVESVHGHYTVKGGATGCVAFDATGQTRGCSPLSADVLRTLTVSLGGSGASPQTIDTPITDCVNSKLVLVP